MGDLEGRVLGSQGPFSRNEDGKETRYPENPEAVTRRAMEWWNATIVGTSSKHILIVSHGGWIGLLVQGLLQREAIRAEPGVTVGRCLNTGVTVVEIPRERGIGKLLQYGNVMHLRGGDVVAKL
jgi:probable phosphoglycerate mutase